MLEIQEAILCRDGAAIVLTEAHLPNKEIEKDRIIKSGGNIIALKGNNFH